MILSDFIVVSKMFFNVIVAFKFSLFPFKDKYLSLCFTKMANMWTNVPIRTIRFQTLKNKTSSEYPEHKVELKTNSQLLCSMDTDF